MNNEINNGTKLFGDQTIKMNLTSDRNIDDDINLGQMMTNIGPINEMQKNMQQKLYKL